jgi:probable HAF family extracellular repeat protein
MVPYLLFFRPSRSSRRGPTRRRTGRRWHALAPLRVESLEDRWLLSTIINLGAFVSPGAVNASGQVVGTLNGNGPSHAFLYSDGTLTDLGTVDGYAASTGNGLNDSGIVVGGIQGPGGITHAMAYIRGTMTDRGTAPGFTNGYAVGINDSNQAIGNAYNSGPPDHAFLYNAGTLTDLGALFPGGGADAHGINASGEVVGQSGYAFLWKDGGMTNIDNRGVFTSSAAAINDSGQVISNYVIDSHGSTFEPFLWTPDVPNGTTGTAVGLGFLPDDSSATAYAINSSGEVVGYSRGVSPQRAFLYRNGTMTDLNTLLPPNSGWQLQAATAINDSEQIVGYGLLNGQGIPRGYLLNLNDAPAAHGLGSVAGLAQVSASAARPAGTVPEQALAPSAAPARTDPATVLAQAAPEENCGTLVSGGHVGTPASHTPASPEMWSAYGLDLSAVTLPGGP